MKNMKKILSVFLAVLMLFTTFSLVMPVFAQYKAEIEADIDMEIVDEEKEAHIVSEVLDKRTENTKQFLMSDGSYVLAQYNSPVHYLSDENKWIDIDSSLNEAVATTTQSELFGQSNIIRTNNQATNIVFAEKANSNTLVFFDDENYPISLNYQSMKNSQAVIAEKSTENQGDEAFLNLAHLTDEIVYENAYSDVDLQYIVSPNGIKENIILKNASAQNSFTVNYNIGALTAEAVSENVIHLIDGDDVIYVISAPVMYDANGNSSSEIELNITKNKNGKLTFEIVPDKTWLATATYPVTIDPSIMEEEDSTIEGVCVTGNSTSTENFTLTYGSSYALLDIQKSDNNTFLDHVVSAKLNLPVVSGSVTASSRVYVREITDNWKSNGEIINTNPSVATTVEDYMNITASTINLSFDLTGLFSKWENGGSNKGIKLEMGATGSVRFETTSSEPLLTVQYMNTCGLDSSMPYTEFDMGSAGYVYVNNYSGNLVLTRDDEISTTGEEYPYDFSMTYNSLATIDESDSRWFPSYMSGFSSSVVYTASDGTQQLFVEDKDAEREDFYVLKENDYGWDCLKATEYWSVTVPIVGTTIKIPVAFDACKNNCTEKYSFNTSGLQKITIGQDLCSNPKNERVILSREKIEGTSDFYIVDGSGQKLRVSRTDSSYKVTQYSKGATGNHEPGESVTYTFNDDGNVIQIKRNDDVEATFTYDGDKIKSITDNKDHTLTFEYSGSRIEKVTEKRGTETGTTVFFTRTANTVTTHTAGANGEYGDDDDSLVTSRFDSSLNLLGESYATVSGERLGAVSYERGSGSETTSVFDNISRVGVMGRNPENLLKNHSIESASEWTHTSYQDSGCDYTYELSSDVAHSGQYSAMLKVDDVTQNGGATVFQRLDYADGEFVRGKKYVLSAYVKIDEAIIRDANASAEQDYGATLLVRAVKSEGKPELFYGESIQKTDGTVDGGWSRIFVYFTVPDNCDSLYLAGFLRNGIGTAYFDSFQLEEGEIPSRYNLVENSSFENVAESGLPENWIGTEDLENTDVVSNGEFKISGNPDKLKGLYQNVFISDATQSDTYVFSAWSHGDGVPKATDRHYCLFGYVYYKDANGSLYNADGKTNKKSLPITYFDSNSTQEQFVSMPFDLSVTDETWTPIAIRVAVCYYQGVNDVYFDDVSLIRTNDVIDLTETETETNYVYDENGNIVKFTDNFGTVFDYDSNQRIVSETYTNGAVYNYTYDDKGSLVSRLKTVTDENGVEIQVGNRYSYIYNGDDRYTIFESYEAGLSYTYEYDSNYKMTKKTSVADGNTTVDEYAYDENGNLIEHKIDNVVKERYTYVKVNGKWFIKTETGDNYVIAYSYNESEEITSKVKTQNDTVIESDSYEYTNGNVTKHTHTENGTSLTYHYGTDGEITRVDHNGFSYVYEYDNFGNTTNVSVDDNPNDNNNGQSLIQYNYQADKSKLASMTYGNGDTVSYEYDNYGGISRKILSDEVGADKPVTYYYTYLIDGEGRPIYEKDSMSGEKTTYQYDFQGNLVGERVYNTLSYTYANQLYEINNNFDEDGNIIKNALQTHVGTLTTNYAYDAESGLPSSVTLFGGRSVSYNYDDEGTLTGRSLSTSTPVAESFSHNDEGLISTHTIARGTSSDVYSYTYDDNANITEIKKGDTVQQSYVYDALNQLTRENDRDTGKTVTYSYDGYGNILSKTEYAFTLGELGAVVDTVNYSYDSEWKDKLISYDSEAITYDEIGNPITYRGATMTWFGRQMMSYSKNGTNISYTYDADGLRTSKTVNGVKHNYYYVDGQLRYERNGDSYEIYYTYDADGRPVLATKRDLVAQKNYQYYLITNTRGDVIETRNGDGNVNAKFVYDAWGKLVSVTDANGNALSTDSFAYQISLKYRGYVYDNETGLYYLQSRYYDPETGRFLNADDVDYIGYSGEQLSYNIFAYCENNAVCCIDICGFIGIRITWRFITHYIYVRKYLHGLTGHVDFEIDGYIYSYGTGGASCPEKINGIAEGYVSISPRDHWLNNVFKHCVGTVKIGLTTTEYWSLNLLIFLFRILFLDGESVVNDPNIPVKRYLVKYGKYSYYSYTSANCSTFVSDFLGDIVYGFKNKAELLYGGLSNLITPGILYSVAKSVGEEI